MKQGDRVVYLKDKQVVVYKIAKIEFDKVHIKGEFCRIYRVVSKEDIRQATDDEIEKEKEIEERNLKKFIGSGARFSKHILGKVLHIDGDESYLNKCLEFYKSAGISVNGVCIKENEIANQIDYYIDLLSPDIVVITGHDLYNEKGIKDLENYTNTSHFMEAVKKIRKKKSSFDCCVIAGACQSNFEALIASGADIASSPARINVHTFDPAVIAVKVASTSFIKKVDMNEVWKYIEKGKEAYSGVETLGKMKLLF